MSEGAKIYPPVASVDPCQSHIDTIAYQTKTIKQKDDENIQIKIQLADALENVDALKKQLGHPELPFIPEKKPIEESTDGSSNVLGENDSLKVQLSMSLKRVGMLNNKL